LNELYVQYKNCIINNKSSNNTINTSDLNQISHCETFDLLSGSIKKKLLSDIKTPLFVEYTKIQLNECSKSFFLFCFIQCLLIIIICLFLF
jgi:hypothetical protein